MSADCFSVCCHFARLGDFLARCWEIRGKANLGFVAKQRKSRTGGNLRRIDSDYELYEGDLNVKKLYILNRAVCCGRIYARRLAPTMSHKFISHTSNGNDQFGSLRILFKLLAKTRDVRVDGARQSVGLITPDGLQQLSAGNS